MNFTVMAIFHSDDFVIGGDEVLFFVLLFVGVPVLYMLIRSLGRKARRRQYRSRPFPEGWKEILARNLTYYPAMPDDLKEKLHGHIHVFLAEKSFEGCGGLELNDEIKVTIAAQACMLILGRETDFFPKMGSILVYPSTYFTVPEFSEGDSIDDISIRAGEAWRHGPVVISWDDFKRGTSRVWRPSNGISHEFAHVLDLEDGTADGAPILRDRADYGSWSKILGREYETLKEKTEKAKRTLLDKYGARNPGEFFAVVTEAFFEMPERLERKHPELYVELAKFYGIDPASWREPREGRPLPEEP